MNGRPARAAVRACLAGGLVLGLLWTWPGSPPGAAAPLPSLDTIVIPDLGPGYSVTSEGPLNASQFASSSPDPAAASTALATLAGTISTYERAWADESGVNEVQDLLVRFPSAVGARVFLQAARHSLDSGEIVSSGALPGVVGASRTTYFGSTTRAGVGQAITMRAGVYVDLLSFFAAASGNPQPITPADAAMVARAQRAAMVAARGGTSALPATSSSRGISTGSIGAAALVVAVLAAAMITPLVMHRRRRRTPPTA